MKCRARRSEPETTKRRHIAVPPSCELTPVSDFLLVSLCPSQADGAGRAACPVRALEPPQAPPAEVGLALLPDAAPGVAGAHAPLRAAAARYVAAEVVSFPHGDATRSAAVVAQSMVQGERALPLGADAVLRLVARVAAGLALHLASHAPRLAARGALVPSLPVAGPAPQPDERVLPLAGEGARADAGPRPDGLALRCAAADAARWQASPRHPWVQRLQAVARALRPKLGLAFVQSEAWPDLQANVQIAQQAADFPRAPDGSFAPALAHQRSMALCHPAPHRKRLLPAWAEAA
jgi:hypothetical protein